MIRKRYLIAGSIAFPCLIGGALFLAGLWIPNYPDANKYPVRGLDVSAHQNNIDWPIVAKSGVRFVYIKATEGSDFKDSHFTANAQGAAQSGLKCGAYHYFGLSSSGEAQAHNFLQTISNQRLELPPAVDLEFEGNSSVRPSVEEVQTELRHFLDAVRYSTGREPLIYTSPDFQKTYLQGFQIDQTWLPDYVLRPSPNSSDWKVWQFSERGKVQGIDGFVDMDVFRGSEQEFVLFTDGK